MSGTSDLKVRMTGDLKPLKKEMDAGKQMMKQFSSESKTAIDEFASVFGVNMGAVRESVGKAQNMLGSFGKGFSQAASASGVLSGALKVLKMALVSTGIGAIVVALGSLVTYLTKTAEGSDKLAEILGGVKAVINVLIDRVAAFGKGVFLIFTGKFKEGWESLKDSVKGVGAEIKEEYKAGAALAERLEQLEDREIALIEVQARRRKEIADLRLRAKYEKTEEERLAALKKAVNLEQAIMNDELSIERERTSIMQAQYDMQEKTDERSRALAEQKAKLYEIEQRSLEQQRSMSREINSLTKEIEKQAEAVKNLRDAELERLTAASAGMQRKETIGVSYNLNLTGLKPTSKAFDDLVYKSKQMQESIRQLSVAINEELNYALQDAVVGLGEWLGAMMIGDATIKDFGLMVAGVFADMAIRIGEIAIATGLAVAGIKTALESLNPAVAFTAGIALIALGTAVKGALKSMAKGSSQTSANAPQYSFDTRKLTPQQKLQVEVTGEFVQRGRDLVAVISNENRRKGVVT